MSTPAAAVPAKLGDDERFTPEAAEMIIRRAVRLHERTSNAVSVDVVKDTLASMGIAPATVERAAADVRQDLKDVPSIRRPSDLFAPIAGFVITMAPGLALVLFRDDVPMLPPWLALAIGVWMLVAGFYSQVKGIARWWRKRHLHARLPE